MHGNNEIALVSFCYAIEVAPTIQNICSYLYEHDFGVIDVFVDRLYRHREVELAGVNLINADQKPPRPTPLRRLLRIDEKRAFAAFLNKRIHDYSLVFAVDFVSLDLLHRTGFDLSKVVFISFEGIDFMREYGREHAAKLISKCAFSVVQSKERGHDIERYLGDEVDFEYLPVSLRPVPKRDKERSHKLKLVYSGYFADWAYLLEFLRGYQQSRSYECAELILQGHAMGTDKYVEQVNMIIKGIPGVTVDTSYYAEEEHHALLAANDVGLAFYKDLTGTGNFDNLILSSGKIAAYLWNGLAVFTNVVAPETEHPPFVYMGDFSGATITNGVESVLANRELYKTSAYELAARNYNFNYYMSDIIQRRFSALTVGGQLPFANGISS
jgi:hypothetical protein